jgi:hypothetical protein
MKRIVSLSLLFVFLLNVLGYYGIFLGIRNQIADQMQESFDGNNYSMATGEIIFKMPIAMPYSADMNEYDRVDGEFEHKGEIYRLVKQKFLHDTLYIVCVKDVRSEKIDQALEDYVKTFSSNPSGEKGNSKTIQVLIKDYFSATISVESNNLGWELSFGFTEVISEKTAQFHSTIIQPPRA